MRHVRFEKSAPQKRSFFDLRDPWGHGISLWVVALLIFLAPIAVLSLRQVRMDNNVESWLPDHDPSAMEYAWCREHFPELEKLVLTWRGSSLNDPRLPILMSKLQGQVDADGVRRGGLPYVDGAIHAGQVLNQMVELGVEPEEAVRRLRGTLLGQGWLKVRLTKAGLENRDRLEQQIIAQAKQRWGVNVVTRPAVRPWMPAEGNQERFDALRQQVVDASPEGAAIDSTVPVQLGEHNFQLSWSGISNDGSVEAELERWVENLKDSAGTSLVADCFRSTGSPFAVVIALTEAGNADKNTALTAIRQAAIDSMIPADDIILGGRVVSGHELNSAVLRAAWNPQATSPLSRSVIGLSGLVGIIFALYSLRSLRLGLLVIGISYYAALLGMALIPLSGGSMNMVLVVMPTLLMVLTLSGAIHVANYWKHAAWEDSKSAVSRAIQMAGQPCLLAAFTTALGLVSLAGSQLRPVREFGIYSSIGTMISVFMVLYGLPALLQMAPLRRVRPDDVNPKKWIGFGNFICRHWHVAALLYIAVSIGFGAGLSRFAIETKVIRYFPEHSRLVKDFQHIEDSLAGICPVEIVVRFDQQAQDDLRFLERLEIVRNIEESIRSHSDVSGTLSLADFQPNRPAPADDASTREKIFYNRRSSESEKRAKSGETQGASDFIAMTRKAPLETAPRPGEDELWRINAQAAILTDIDYDSLTDELSSRVANVTSQHPGMDYLVTGTVPLFLQTQRAVLQSLIWSFVMALGLIALVMIWVLRDFTAGIISMIPNILPVISVFGLVSWFGQKIDIGTMVTASVALGIAVDGTLHLLTWFQDGLRRGEARHRAVVLSLAHCGPAMWQTSAAVGLGLMVLFPAELLLISRFGWLMAALIGSAFLGDVILLPCLLVGPLGAVIERRLRRRGEIGNRVSQPGTSMIPPHHLPLADHVRDESRYVS